MRKAVLHIVPSLGAGGNERVCMELVKGLRSYRNVDSHVLARRLGTGVAKEWFKDAGVCSIEVMPAGRIRQMYVIAMACLRTKPTSVVLHFFGIDHVVCGAIAKALGVRTVIVHVGMALSGVSAAAWKKRIILRLSRIIRLPFVCVSNHVYRTVKQVGALPSMSTVIPNGCDVEGIAKRAEEARRHRRPGPFRIAMVARLDHAKDHPTLLRALAAARQLRPHKAMQLMLFGEGPTQTELTDLARTLGILDVVMFMGTRYDIPECLGESDVFVFSATQHEGFGLALLEALSANVPVIASDVPACLELTKGGRWGRLYRSGDPGALCDCIVECIDRTGDIDRPSTAELADQYGIAAVISRYANLMTI